MKDKIIKIVKENVFELLDKDIDRDTKLISTGYLESFDVIGLFESEFDIELDLEKIELSSFETVGLMEELICSHV